MRTERAENPFRPGLTRAGRRAPRMDRSAPTRAASFWRCITTTRRDQTTATPQSEIEARHSRASGNPGPVTCGCPWAPACAGATVPLLPRGCLERGRFSFDQPRDHLIGRHYIAENAQDVGERRIVLVIGRGRIGV